jgi:pilus assembly protein Flp/PilA
MKKLKELMRSTRAATAVEYGLILALIFLAASVAIQGTGNATINMWNHVSDEATGVL